MAREWGGGEDKERAGSKESDQEDYDAEYERLRSECEEQLRQAEQDWLRSGWRQGLEWALLRSIEREAKVARESFRVRGDAEEQQDTLWRQETQARERERLFWRARLLGELGQVLRELTMRRVSRDEIIENREGVLVRVHNVINDEEREYAGALFDRWAEGSQGEEIEGGQG